MAQFTFVDLFAGIGGMRLAFEAVGGRCVFSSEWDGACRAMYAANFGGEVGGDIREVAAEAVPAHDVLVGGFPCQAFSIIGRKRGFADTRGTLFFEIERILRGRRPRAFLLENVRQLLTHDGGRTFAVICGRLRALGYGVHYRVLNGLEFGVPQKRERVVVVGFFGGGAFVFPSGGGRRKTLGEVLLPEGEVPRKYFLSAAVLAKRARRLREQGKTLPPPPFVVHENKSGNLGIHPFCTALRAGGSHNYVAVNGVRRPTPRELLRLQGFPDAYRIVVADSHVRRQAGNSVVVPKIAAVAGNLVAAMGVC